MRMKKTLFILGLLVSIITGGTLNSAHAFYGKQSHKAILTFKGKLEVESDLDLEDIKEDIKYQTSFLLGTFHSKSFVEEFGSKGVVGERQRIFDIQIEHLPETDRDLVTYQFEAEALFNKDAFRRKKTIHVPIKLPLYPKDIYDFGLVGDVNKCTDEHYNSEGDFFYFWDPDQENCPLKENKKHILRIKGTLKKLKKTKRTYPAYEKIFGDNGNGLTTRADLFFGYIESKAPRNLYHYLTQTISAQDPEASIKYVDDAILSAYEMSDYLEDKGFELFNRTLFGDLTQKQEWKLSKKGLDLKDEPTMEEGPTAGEKRTYTKTFPSGKEVVVNIIIAQSDFQDNKKKQSTLFKNMFEDALEKADLIDYEGHSGLGGNLDLESLYGDRDIFNPDKYQIIFINGCHSYAYFKNMFLNRKNHPQNLDLILSGLSTLSDDAVNNSKAFLKYFINPDKSRRPSYQAILNAIERSNNEENGTYLTSVFGDINNF
jgi:hypothetical protein